ncbi:MAG: DUF58 domain-containing protein [Burkholderiales bacterium]|nr:DUF58 domain-containing protein [Burkholderiales bacterium]
MRPTPLLLVLACLWALAGALAAAWPAALAAWQAGGVLLGAAAVADWLLARAPLDLVVERAVAGSLPIGAASEVRLAVANRSPRRLSLVLHDHHPRRGLADGLPAALAVAPGQRALLSYRFTPTARGDDAFAHCDVRVASPAGLWQARRACAAGTPVRIYPNFAALTRYALLATDNRLSQIGILTRRRRGLGADFHQLREYREGDTPRQIDWNATARMRKLISREYRDERDQQIVFLIDCGRRMAASDTDARHLRHFDHVLNAALLMGYVSLRHGDAVGFMTFGTETPRTMAPRKSAAALTSLLNGLYDVQPSLMMPDFMQAALACARRQSRRALVVVLTNLRDEDDDELGAAMHLLGRRHLVLLASLREPSLDATLARPVTDHDGALTYAAAADYRDARERALSRVRAAGALVLDVAPNRLPVALVNRYLQIKRAGML